MSRGPPPLILPPDSRNQPLIHWSRIYAKATRSQSPWKPQTRLTTISHSLLGPPRDILSVILECVLRPWKTDPDWYAELLLCTRTATITTSRIKIHSLFCLAPTTPMFAS